MTTAAAAIDDDDDHHHHNNNNLNQNITGFTEESCSDSDNKIIVNVGRTIVPANNDDDHDEDTDKNTMSVVAVRFWWIRHGETIANHDGVVVGQWDSPLSIKGQHQATMLGKHLFFSSRDVINSNNSDDGTTAKDRGDTNGDNDDDHDDGGTNRNRNENIDDDIETKKTTKKKQAERKAKQSQTGWSRIYCSDLGRTRQTLSVMLNGSTGNNNHFRNSVEEEDEPETNSCSDSTVNDNNSANQGGYVISYDKRLREVAKGVRQEFPKSWTSQQALIERQRLDKPTNILQESRADVWSRVAHFVTSVMIDRYYDNQTNCNTQSIDSNCRNLDATSCRPKMTTSGELNKNKNNIKRNRDVEDVMVISHAGLIRTMLQYMVPAAHPSLSHRDDEHDLHGPPDDTKRLAVPNTSVTVLEVRMNPIFIQTLQQRRRLPRDDPQQVEQQPVHLQQEEQDDDGNKSFRRMPHCPRHQQEQEQINEPNHEKQHETDLVDDSMSATSTAVTDLFQNEDSTTRDDLILQLDPVTNYNDLWTTTVMEFMWTGHLNDSEGSTNDE